MDSLANYVKLDSLGTVLDLHPFRHLADDEKAWELAAKAIWGPKAGHTQWQPWWLDNYFFKHLA